MSAIIGWDSVPILCINLDRRPDRLGAVTSELARLGRVFDGDRTRRIAAFDHPTDGAIGCSMSQLHCLELAIAQGWPAVAILEDDFQCTRPAVFRRTVDAFLETTQRQGFPRWDVLMLGGNVRRSTPSSAFADSGVDAHRVHAAFSSVAYLVHGPYLATLRDNLRASIQLLSAQPALGHQYALDVYWQRLQARDAWFICHPLTINQAPGFSDIERRVVDYSLVMLNGLGPTGANE